MVKYSVSGMYARTSNARHSKLSTAQRNTVPDSLGPTDDNTRNTTCSKTSPILLSGSLAWNKQPPKSDQYPHAGTYPKGTCTSNSIDQCPSYKTSEKEGEDGNDLVIAGDDTKAERKQLRVHHKLAPNSGQND